MIEVEIFRIVIDEAKREQIIMLKEKSGERVLPIIIGIAEATAIKMKFSNFKPPRPLSHDLMSDILTNLDVKLEKVIIDNLIEGTYHAKLHLRKSDGNLVLVDARPSDSVALAARTNSPIFVKEHILEKIA